MKRNILNLSVLLPLLALLSCTDDVMDRINSNTSTPPASAVSARIQLTDAITSTVFSTLNGGYAWFAASYTEQLFGDGNNLLMYAELRDPSTTTAAATFNNEWRNTYQNLQNIKQMRAKCEPGGLNAGHTDIQGMAEVLWCVEWHALTALCGDIPYTEALDAKNKTPRLDRQEDIYADLLDVSADAVRHLEEAVSKGLANAGVQDLLYGGDASKWLGLAHAVRARMLLDGSVRNPEYIASAGAEAQAAIDCGFEGAWLDIFNTTGQDNSWAAFMKSRKYLGANQTLADMLREDNDPRLPLYERDSFGSGIAAAPAGDEPLAVTTQQVGAPAWLDNFAAPLSLLSLSELHFILAESAARQGQDPTAAYRAAVDASFSEWAWCCGSAVEPHAAAELRAEGGKPGLDKIMRQKYIAMAVAGVLTAYNDLRRQRALGENWVQLRNPHNTLGGANQWPLRMPYGSSDVQANPHVAEAFGSGNAAGAYVLTTPVWLFK